MFGCFCWLVVVVVVVCISRDYLWTSQQSYLTLDHLWKIYELDETWDKVR